LLTTYIALSSAPLIWAATKSSFWERKHSLAPLAVACLALLFVALVYRRKWAWVLLVLFEGSVVISLVVDRPAFVWIAVDVISFALLISRPMRAHVGIKISPSRPGASRR